MKKSTMVIYKFTNIKTGEIIYIRKSKNFTSRILNHMGSYMPLLEYSRENNCMISYQEYNNKVDASIMELYYINKYNPIYNKADKFGYESTFKLKEPDWNEWQDTSTYMSKRMCLNG